VRTRQNQFTISTPTAVMAARGTDGILGYSMAAAAGAPPKPGVVKPGVPATTGAAAGGPTTLLCLGGVSALIALPTVPGTTGTGEQVFCENGQIWRVEAGAMNLLMVLPNSVRAALEAGASPQAIKQIVENMTPVQVIWTSVEQAVFDATPFDLPPGPTQTEVTQLTMAALNTNMPTTTIATANFVPTTTFQTTFMSIGTTGESSADFQRQQAAAAPSPASAFLPPPSQ
jgi:hypothetical protein